MPERWAPIPGWPGYQASTRGRIRSLDRVVTNRNGHRYKRKGCTLRTGINWARGGYATVTLSGRTQYVHRLVLQAYVGPCPEGMEGCHNDGNPLNNSLDNLRWDTFSANKQDTLRHGTNARARRTHCPRNHPLVGVNLKPSHLRDGRRVCLACCRAMNYVSRLRGRGVPADLQPVSDRYYAAIMSAVAS